VLRIERIRLYSGRMPVDLEFSYGSVRSLSYCIAEVTAGGEVGWGEGDSIRADECVALGRSLLGQDALRLDQLIPRVAFAWRTSVAREMFSMALHDLVARHAGLPLYVLLGGWQRERVPLMPCIFPKTPEHAREVARRFVAAGFNALKVKIFGKPDLDLALIGAVREVLPAGYLQADANCGYKTRAEARAILPRLAEAGLTTVEDPADVAPEEYLELLAVSPRPRVMLDAPTRGDAGLAKVLRLQCADAVNLHPNMQGTFSEIRERAAACRLAGLPVQVGGTGYTGVGAFAHLHVAAVYGTDFPFGELGGWVDHGMPASTAAAPLPVQAGSAIVPCMPGHGGALNHDYLRANAEVIEVSEEAV